MTTTVEREPGRVVLTVTGDLDFASSGAFRAVALDALGFDPVLVVLDLAEVAFIDSSGITALVLLRRKARSRRSELRVVTNRRIDGVLRIAGLTHAFETFASLPAALAAQTRPA